MVQQLFLVSVESLVSDRPMNGPRENPGKRLSLTPHQCRSQSIDGCNLQRNSHSMEFGDILNVWNSDKQDLRWDNVMLNYATSHVLLRPPNDEVSDLHVEYVPQA